MLKSSQAALRLVLALLAAWSLWFYVDHILVGYQVAEAAAHDRPRGNLSDLYPRWLGARELLLHRRNPYSPEITLEIQRGYYGRAVDPSRAYDPKDRQGFAYPVYVVFLLAPLVGLPFHTVQLIFHWLLIVLMAASVLWWARALCWRASTFAIVISIVLLLGSLPAVQGIKLQQLSLLVTAMLAASAACISAGWLFTGGLILALATIKPQLVLPIVFWLTAWCLSDWRSRRRLAVGFLIAMAALLTGSEIVLPGWWRMFLHAVREYHQYTQNESVLDQLVNWAAGSFAGDILAAIAVALTIAAIWPARKQLPTSPEFGRALALICALTVLIVPMYAPYNQVLLVPAVFSIWKDRRIFISASPVMRAIYALGALALLWPWIASMTLTAIWFISQNEALKGWKAPFYATFAFPVAVFALALLDAKRQRNALR